MSHVVRIKRGKERHYPTSSLRRQIKKGCKKLGLSRKKTKKATSAGWW